MGTLFLMLIQLKLNKLSTSCRRGSVTRALLCPPLPRDCIAWFKEKNERPQGPVLNQNINYYGH